MNQGNNVISLHSNASNKHKLKRLAACEHISVDAATSFGFRVRYREVILFEREAGMPNWPLNMDVV